MADFFEIDFLDVETSKSGDAITIRYSQDNVTRIHVVDGGYIETGEKLVLHMATHYASTTVDHVVLTHPDQDHANGLRKVLEDCVVGTLWMNRPWLYAEELIHRFETYTSVDALRKKLRSTYAASAMLEDIALEKGIPIEDPMQGAKIGAFTVLAPTKARYLDLIVASEKTPEAVKESAATSVLDGLFKVLKAVTTFIKSAWGDEYFPADGTSSENEMSVIQYANLSGKRILLTGDAGRDALAEAANFAPAVGLTLPGIGYFQVPHHGGRHNVNTELLDRWLGERLPSMPRTTTWSAVCSSAKADEDHPRKSVVRAMLHRGAHFAATEGRNVCLSHGISRTGWVTIPQETYPDEQEN
ncbi:ComEC/Rec2 family competence protein [Burkholderia sp. L27(2015)]|uniref:ComEC/Rec2 family competence protein n=1 Tax=Burkholderia sp. L27(2015) TaxID=1641858 RepID=UPI00131E1DC2|nr:MBL fold metallo-hydrolase [Burkholderia sp. L27(2015)]